jgi:hypothetical protein
MRKVLLMVSAAAMAAAQPPGLSREDMEQFLRSARIVEMRELAPGVTSSRRAVLDDGKLRHDAHIQTVNITKDVFEGTRGKINFRDTYHYNLAAYELDKLLGLNMMPPSVEREVAGQWAAVTWWVDETAMSEGARVRGKLEPPDRDKWIKQMYIVRVFDQLIYNTDRNLENLIYSKDWKLWMLDHTRAFRMFNTLPSPANLVKCDRKLLSRLRGLNKDELTSLLKPHLTSLEIDGLLGRRDAIVKWFDSEIANKGEAAVLYDWL